MKKLLATLAVTLGTAALAQSADVNTHTQTQQEQQNTEGRKISTGLDASDIAPGLNGSKAEKQEKKESKAESQHALMDKAHAFKVNGTFEKEALGAVSLSRAEQNLPNVDLRVKDQTQVLLDGKKVSAKDIPEGSQVRASFQMDGLTAVALELNATSPKGVAGGAKKGTKSTTKETKTETKTETKGEKSTTPAPAPETQQGTTGTQPAPKP